MATFSTYLLLSRTTNQLPAIEEYISSSLNSIALGLKTIIYRAQVEENINNSYYDVFKYFSYKVYGYLSNIDYQYYLSNYIFTYETIKYGFIIYFTGIVVCSVYNIYCKTIAVINSVENTINTTRERIYNIVAQVPEAINDGFVTIEDLLKNTTSFVISLPKLAYNGIVNVSSIIYNTVCNITSSVKTKLTNIFSNTNNTTTYNSNHQINIFKTDEGSSDDESSELLTSNDKTKWIKNKSSETTLPNKKDTEFNSSDPGPSTIPGQLKSPKTTESVNKSEMVNESELVNESKLVGDSGPTKLVGDSGPIKLVEDVKPPESVHPTINEKETPSISGSISNEEVVQPRLIKYVTTNKITLTLLLYGLG